MSRLVEVRSGAYQDSVNLMLVSRALAAREGVKAALVAMATELNLELLVTMGFEPLAAASPNDMIVAVEAIDNATASDAVAGLEAALAALSTPSSPSGSAEVQPPTVRAAARRGDANLVLVSTPGRVAALDAVDALDCDLDVMIFSDNVPLDQELMLKDRAVERGLLVMGPDCGTAVVDGVGLGFANVVRPGPVGIVAASGTGAQHMLSLLDSVDIGVKHCLGVGGRDLSAEIGGRSTLVALDRLAADDDIAALVLVSKPPAGEVADLVSAHAAGLAKPVVLGYLGPGRPDLTATAAEVAAILGVTWREPPRWGPAVDSPRDGFLRGLFSGGTLCDEAMVIALDQLPAVTSNIPLAGQEALDSRLTARGHTFIDFGDDQLTVGRPHPMIDGSMRLERLSRELADPDCAVVLLDVVLGHGAHPDPAADLAPVIAAADKPVVVALVGTRDDPQDTRRTAERLVEAGAVVHASNAAAAREAVGLVSRQVR